MNFVGFEKEKNIVKFFVEGKEKHYEFNINTGEMIGLRGNVLVKAPAGLLDYLYRAKKGEEAGVNTLNELYDIIGSGRSLTVLSSDFGKRKLSLIDRLESIGYILSGYVHWTEKDCEILEKYFKDFTRAYKQNEHLLLSEWMQSIRCIKYMEQHNRQFDDYITIPIVNYCITHFNEEEQIEIVLYYCARGGLYDFFDDYHRATQLIDYFQRYFAYCDRLNIPYVKSNNFIKEYLRVEKEYKFRQTQVDNEALKKNQEAVANKLTFSAYGLTTIIPTTTIEFEIEANAQNNCVKRLYLPKVIDNLTNIVFVRKVDDINKPYITCEVRNGSIWQYLGKNNSSVKDENANAFYQAYKEHLNKMF